MGPTGDMMFAVSFFGYTHTEVNNMFTLSLEEESFSAGYVLTNVTEVALVQCTQEHFNFSAETIALFDNILLSEAFCPPLNHSFTVRGKMSSKIFQQFKISIHRCFPDVNSTCMDDATFNADHAN